VFLWRREGLKKYKATFKVLEFVVYDTDQSNICGGNDFALALIKLDKGNANDVLYGLPEI